MTRVLPVLTFIVSVITLLVLVQYLRVGVELNTSKATNILVDTNYLTQEEGSTLDGQTFPIEGTEYSISFEESSSGQITGQVFNMRSDRGDSDVCCKGFEAGACGWRSADKCVEVCGASSCSGGG